MILPLIIVSAISTSICHYVEPASFYLKELVEHGQLLRPGTDARVLSELSLMEVLEKDCILVDQDMLLGEFVEIIKKSHRNHFPVQDADSGLFLGMLHLDDIRPYLFDPNLYQTVFLEQLMDRNVKTARPEDSLADVMNQMDRWNLFSMPVVSNGRFLGMVSKATILNQYRKELMVMRLSPLGPPQADCTC